MEERGIERKRERERQRETHRERERDTHAHIACVDACGCVCTVANVCTHSSVMFEHAVHAHFNQTTINTRTHTPVFS